MCTNPSSSEPLTIPIPNLSHRSYERKLRDKRVHVQYVQGKKSNGNFCVYLLYHPKTSPSHKMLVLVVVTHKYYLPGESSMTKKEVRVLQPSGAVVQSSSFVHVNYH